MKPLCDLCGSRHESYQAHVFKPAINEQRLTQAAINTKKATAFLDELVRSGVGGDARSPNRRSRAAYNEYMRGYMRKRRAAARSAQ